MLAHYNQTGMKWSQGEFTGSGAVDINDLTIVLAHYNQTSGSSAAGSALRRARTSAMAILPPPPRSVCWPAPGGSAINRERTRCGMLRGTVAACCALSLVLAGAGIAAASAGFTDTELYSSSATNIYGSVASAFDARGGDILSMFGGDGTNGGAWVWQGNNPANSSGTGVFTLPSWASGAEIAYGMNGSGTIVVGRAYASPGSTVTPFAYTIGSASNGRRPRRYDANPATGASNSGACL